MKHYRPPGHVRRRTQVWPGHAERDRRARRNRVQIEARVQSPTHYLGVGYGAIYLEERGQSVIRVTNPYAPPEEPGGIYNPIDLLIQVHRLETV